MKLLLQRVHNASVSVEGKTVGSIHEGYLIFLGVVKGDTQEQAVWLAEKTLKLKLFDENTMDIVQKGGSVLVVSQFTLAARIESGTKPDFSKAAPGPEARPLYELFVQTLRDRDIRVATGVFGAMMEVSLTNSGPYTILMER